MKHFEEQFTAWVDGTLSGPELTAFEKELEAHPDALSGREDAKKLRALLREKPTAPKLANADFFNLQIRQRIAADLPRAHRMERASGWFWSWPRLLVAGAACLLLAGVMFQALIPIGSPESDVDNSPYFAQVVESWTSEPGVSASTVYNPQDNVTVLWLDGLDYIPASHQLN